MNAHLHAAWRDHRLATSRCFTAALLAALAVAALGLALTAASASAAPPPSFVGTQSWKDPSGAQFDKLQQANTQTFRSQMAWTSVEPDAPTGACRCVHSYRWGRYDRQFEMAARRGIRVLPILLGSPSWASRDVRWPPVAGKPGDADWKRQAFYDFAKAASKRYGPNGDFWQGKSFPANVRARYWQVWNEPNLPNYWWNKVNAAEYARLLKITSAALKTGDPSALTVTGGVPWSRHAPIHPPEFLQKVFSVSGTTADYVAIHPYARTPNDVLEGVRLARRALNSTRAKGTPLWLTEFGWSTGGRASSYTVSESTQAKYLRETYRKLLGARSTYGIHGAIWFNLQDVNRGTAWYYKTGLLRSDGRTPKPSWKALRCVTSGGSFCG